MEQVRILKDYNDTQLKRLVKKDEILEVKEERAKVLFNAGVGSIIVGAIVVDEEEIIEPTEVKEDEVVEVEAEEVVVKPKKARKSK